MTEHYLDNKIYYRINEFKPDRQTLVFVHGVSGSSSAWLPYEKIFENRYNILTYDIRGHGNSKKYPSYKDYEVDNFATDLHELVNHLNISKFILISNSFGSQVALKYIQLWRDTVVGSVFTSPEVYMVDGVLASVARPLLGFLNFVLKLMPFDSRPRGRVDYSKYVGSTDWSIGRNLADMMNTTLRVHFNVLRQSFNRGYNYAFEKIQIPTLIIHGVKDTMVPINNALKMHANIADSEFLSIPNVDHNTVHNAVKEMAQAIASFINKIAL